MLRERGKGVIDQTLEKALSVVDEMIVWYEENHLKRGPSRKDFSGKVIHHLSNCPRTCKTIEQGNGHFLHDFYVGIAHGAATAEADFDTHLAQLENLLLSSLSREPAQDFSTIDDILAEDE